MKKSDFYFDLPTELIAQYPSPTRSDSKLLVYCRQSSTHTHTQFHHLAQFLNPGDLLVLNDTKVVPARFHGVKTTGGKVECLLERIESTNLFWAHIKASKSPKPGTIILLQAPWQIKILEKREDLYLCEAGTKVETLLQAVGHIPLPPYIERQDEALDWERYQTVYASHEGSVAAPTAGLHFDEALLTTLKQKGVEVAYCTLHVGAGTFRPVRCENILDHKMHEETFVVEEELVKKINQTKALKNRVVAVGTTTLRSLESAAQAGNLQAYKGTTDIFITPGFNFKVCDGLITNFHLPESTLLMLVSAFIGQGAMRELYQEAMNKKYRFFSYGDASLLL